MGNLHYTCMYTVAVRVGPANRRTWSRHPVRTCTEARSQCSRPGWRARLFTRRQSVLHFHTFCYIPFNSIFCQPRSLYNLAPQSPSTPFRLYYAHDLIIATGTEAELHFRANGCILEIICKISGVGGGGETKLEKRTIKKFSAIYIKNFLTLIDTLNLHVN